MAKRKAQGHPAKDQKRGREVTRSPEEKIAIGAMAMYEGVTDLVRQHEALVIEGLRRGVDVDPGGDLHLQLRSSALGLLTVWSKLRGLPDPREAIMKDSEE